MARLLVIDDEKNVRKMIRLALEKASHEVLVAEDGWSGLTLFGEGEAVDLTLLDHRMPGMDGSEVLRVMRSRRPDARVIVVTAFAGPELAADVIQAGATDLLRKPFSADVLRGAVQVALNRTPAPTPPRSTEPDPIANIIAIQSTPMVTVWLNGFHFWPTGGRSESGPDVTRQFRVRGPQGESCHCVVRVTPHIQEFVCTESKSSPPPEGAIWDRLCEAELCQYLWDKADLPPQLLPLFELSSAQLEIIRDADRLAATIDY